MSKPLKQNCTDFQAYKFFQDCRQQIRKIAQSSKLQKTIAKTMAKVQSFKSAKTQQLDRMLLNNIAIDYIRSHKLDYTYPVFMRQCNMISEQIAGKKKLATLIGVEEQLNNDERFNVSLIELMVKKIENINQRNKQFVEYGIQVETMHRSGEDNHALLMENKMREVRQEVQKREKKYYEKMLENIRSREIMELRSQISKQMQSKYNKDKQKLNKKYQQLIEKAKSEQNPSKLKEQNDSLLNKNFQLSQEISKTKSENDALKRQNRKHDCKKSEQFKKLNQSMRQQRKQLQQKKKQLEFALRNLNTKVQDLVAQKKKIQGQNKTDAFVHQTRVHRQNKDHMIQTIYAQMRQMDSRVKVLSQQNNNLRQQIRQLKSNIKHKQQLYSLLKQESLSHNNTIVNNQNFTQIPSGFDSNQMSEIRRNYEPNIQVDVDNKRTDPINPRIPSYRDINKNTVPMSNPNSIQPFNPKCTQCQRRKSTISTYKPRLINVSVGVKEQDFTTQEQDKQSDSYEEQSSQFQSNAQQLAEKDLQHKKRLAKLKADMRIIKNNVMILVRDDF